jgi:hypothetical protein
MKISRKDAKAQRKEFLNERFKAKVSVGVSRGYKEGFRRSFNLLPISPIPSFLGVVASLREIISVRLFSASLALTAISAMSIG